MRCMICGADPRKDPVSLHRVNDKGKPGLWACPPHYRQARALHPDDDPRVPYPLPKNDQAATDSKEGGVL